MDWVEAPAEALPFDDATFDLVTARIAPHHFRDVPAFLAETRRVLTPGGVFVLADTTVPDDEPEAADWQNAVERERDGSHVANLSPGTWRRLVVASGFVVTDLDCSGGGIGLELSTWLETAGCTGERADRVRQLFATAPEAARRAFQITTNANGETGFVWQRVVLRAAVAVTQS
jgi:SAM-dependent methyltransferase